jgi:hypothetical protein
MKTSFKPMSNLALNPMTYPAPSTNIRRPGQSRTAAPHWGARSLVRQCRTVLAFAALSTAACCASAQTEVKAWSKMIGGSNYDYGQGIAVDPAGNVVFGGPTQSSLGGQSAGLFDVFAGKCDSSGNLLWLAQRGSTETEYGFDDLNGGVASDIYGNVYVVGRTKGSLDGYSNLGGYDMFLVKFGPNGNWLWTRQDGTSGDDTARAVATDSAGNVYIAGYVQGNFHGVTRVGASDVFISKYDQAGTRQWSVLFGSLGPDEAFGLTCDADRNVIVTGWCGDSIEGNPYLGNGDNFLAKYDTDGQRLWLKQWGTPNKDTGYSLATDASRNIYISGYTAGPLYGPQQGNRDIFLAKFDAGGIFQWGRQMGTSEHDQGWGVAADAVGNVYVTGETGGMLGTDPWAGDQDVFVAKYNTSGTQIWLKQLGTTNFDLGRAIAVDTNGGVFVTGWSFGDFDGSTNQGLADVILMKFAPSNAPPPVPTSRPATALATSAFTANWLSSSFATGYRLDVSTNSAFGNYLAGYQDRDVGNVLSWSVSGLNPGTLYYYRLRAYSTNGTSGNSTTIVAATTILTCTPATLLNGSFEGPFSSQGVATNWVAYVRAPIPPYVNWSMQTASPPTGGGLQYQQIGTTNPPAGGGAGVLQVISGCTPGATYIVSGWMRGNSTRITCTVKVSPNGSTNWATAVDLNPPQSYAGSTWTAFNGTVVAAGTNMTLWLDGEEKVAGYFKAVCFDAVTVSCPYVPPFRFESVAAPPPNQLSLVMSNAPYPSVTIQQSSDLRTWGVLTNLVPTNGTVRFTDTSASNALQRFYNATSP